MSDTPAPGWDRSPEEDRLRGLLSDERARTAWLEVELSKEREKTELWRERAGKRRKSRRRTLVTEAEPRSTIPPGEAPAAPFPPLYPAVRAVVDDRGEQLLGGLFDCLPIREGARSALYAADLVAFSTSTLSMPDEELRHFLELEARIPLLVIHDAPDAIGPLPPLGPNDVIVTSGSTIAGKGQRVVRQPLVGRFSLAIGPREIARLDVSHERSVVALDEDQAPIWICAAPDADLADLVGLAASGAPVFRSADTQSFGDGRAALEGEDYRRAAVLTARWLQDKHSIEAFAKRLAEMTGLDLPDRDLGISVVLISNRPDLLTSALGHLSTQFHSPHEVLVGLHGRGDRRDTALLMDFLGLRGRVFEFDEVWPLGKCMNSVVEEVGTTLFAKIDDDDFYGPGYLQDAAIAFRATNADVVGKATHYVHVEQLGATYLMGGANENRFVSYVPGPSLVSRRSTWERVPFAHRFSRVDSTFVRGVQSLGLRIWSNTRDELIVRRGFHNHTWNADPARFVARGQLAWQGVEPILAVASRGHVQSEDGLLVM